MVSAYVWGSRRKNGTICIAFWTWVEIFQIQKSDGTFLTNGAAYIHVLLLGRAYVFRDKGRHFYSQKMVYNRKDRLTESQGVGEQSNMKLQKWWNILTGLRQAGMWWSPESSPKPDYDIFSFSFLYIWSEMRRTSISGGKIV